MWRNVSSMVATRAAVGRVELSGGRRACGDRVSGGGLGGRTGGTMRAVLIVLWLVLSRPVVAEGQALIPEKAAESAILGGGRLQQALQQRLGFAATGQTLRRAVTEIRRQTGIPVILDRRVDPSTLVDVSTGYVTVRETIQVLADRIPGLSVSYAENYVLIGPQEAAGGLRTLTELNRRGVQQLRRKMDRDAFRQLVEERDVSWPDLTEPRQLVADVAADAGLELENPAAIPHDLWAAARLPAMTFVDLATLVLSQTDQSFEISVDGRVRVVPLPAEISIERTHRVPARDRDVVIERWKKSFPDLDVVWRGTTAKVTGTVELHEQLEALMRGEPEAAVEAAGMRQRRYTVKVPAGTSMVQLIAILRHNGVRIRIRGRAESDLESLAPTMKDIDLVRSPGQEFFPAIFAGWGADVSVGDDEVVLSFPEDGEPSEDRP
ncbi:MAG: hypothetical protein RIK87_05540 [Fuerstiella sp.]